MDRIIGIDYGRARVGVAVSDPLGIFASPLDTVPAAKIIDYLQKYAASETVVRFVVGWPLNLNGAPAEAAADVEALAAVEVAAASVVVEEDSNLAYLKKEKFTLP